MMGAGQPISCVATVGFDDDGVKTTEFPIVRDGALIRVIKTLFADACRRPKSSFRDGTRRARS